MRLLLAWLLVVVSSTAPALAGLINEPNPDLGAAANAAKVKTGVRYWIELHRNGKTTHVTNQQKFLSGDQIRFHVQATVDGYAYIVLRSGSQGEQAVLFSQDGQKDNNKLNRETDYALPAEDFLTFDSNPGTEKVTLLFSKSALDPTKVLAVTFKDANHVVIAAPSQRISGSKDLIPARTTVTYQSEAALTQNDSKTNLYDSVNGAKPDQGMIDSVIAMSTSQTVFKPASTVDSASAAASNALAKANQDMNHARMSKTGKTSKSKANIATGVVPSATAAATTKASTTDIANTAKSSAGAVIVRQDDPEKVLHIDVDLEHS